MSIKDINIKELYSTLEKDRSSLEETWRTCSKLTIPSLFPDENHNASETYETPYNSIGALGVNNLASKLLLSLLPPTNSFFRLTLKDEDISELDNETYIELQKKLSSIEDEINKKIAEKSMRTPLFEAIKLLIVTGNSLVYKTPEDKLKVFNPYQYVVKRDYVGNLHTLIIKEKISLAVLDEDIINQIKVNDDINEFKEEVDIYTCIRIDEEDNNKWEVIQEINEIKIEDSYQTYKKDELPYLVLRWTGTFGEDYGRGLIEQYLGDLQTIENLTKAIVEVSGVSAKIVFGLRPASTTKITELTGASNGDVINGDLERDVSVLQIGKHADLQIPYQVIQVIEQRLSKAFLMVQNAIRDAERVTAQEVRIVANEIESALGGVLSILFNELQKPLLNLLLKETDFKKLKIGEPIILTGLNNVSKERDYQNLSVFLQTIGTLGNDIVAKYLDIKGFLSEIAISLGIDQKQIIKSDEQIKQEQQVL